MSAVPNPVAAPLRLVPPVSPARTSTVTHKASAAASPHDAIALPTGYELLDYRLERVLGLGGFGLTYLATDRQLNLPVAIKEYLPMEVAVRAPDHSIGPASAADQAVFDWGLSRFLDEARTLATFHHPNIVRVMRYFEANQSAYMVMEFVKGASLSAWLQARRPLSQAVIVQMALQLLDGLSNVHRAGYLHRDIKPANIYLREDGSPVLLDFGAARSRRGDRELTSLVSPGYAPLEQYSDSSAQGPWSDLYALGGVLYWMVTGTKPIDATARVRNDPQARAINAADRRLYSEAFLAAIDWALEPDENKRPQDCRQLIAALRDLPAAEDHSFAERTLPRVVAAARLASAPLDAGVLREIEQELAERIGPLASVLVKRASQRAHSVEELVVDVAREIDGDDERKTFTRRMRSHTSPNGAEISTAKPGPAPDRSRPTHAPRFDAAILDRAEKRLSQHIGAVARIVVKQAAAVARDEAELYLLIADEIENPAERKSFIRKAISASAIQRA